MNYGHKFITGGAERVRGDVAMGTTTLGAVSLGELRQVAQLQHRAFQPPLAYGLTTLCVLWALPHVQFIIAREQGHIIGCAIGDKHDGQSRVINLCVDPVSRRNGIATRLLRELESRLSVGDVVLMVEQSNTAAQALYHREGYATVGVSRDYYGRGKDGIWMQKYRVTFPPPKLRI